MADEFATIDLDELADVTGGRYSKMGKQNEIKPELIAAIQELAKAVQSVGQGKTQADQAHKGQQMQFLQKLMEMRGGGGKKP